MKKDRSKSVPVVLTAILLSLSMVLSACSKEEETTKKKKKKSKDKETEEVIDDESDPADTSEEPATTSDDPTTTTTGSTDPAVATTDADKSRVAGTYNGYAYQTKAEAYPDYGSVNNYPILDEDADLVLNADGTATIKDATTGDVEIEAWSVSGETLTINLSGTEVSGTVKDGIVTLDMDTIILFFAADGADTSGIGAIRPEEAYVVQGDDFYFGTGPSGFDLDSARTCYEMAINAGVGKGWYGLGRIYQDKSLEEGHFAKAMECYEKAIEMGDPYGWIGEGFLYAYGDGVEQDLAKAYGLFQQAADAGCLMGYNGMALLHWGYEEIPGISAKDGLKGLEYYEIASHSKDWYERVFALNGTGRVYRYGSTGVTQDCSIAIEWYAKSAEEGYPSAMNNLASLYYNGWGVPQDFSIALEWYTKAVEVGYGDACSTLSYMYENGIGVERDYAKAVEWCRKGIELGDVISVYNLGYFYRVGEGVDVDADQAMELFLLAARENYPRAFAHIGDMYYNGESVEKDMDKALEYWQKGFELWDSSSAAQLGWAYMYGEGVDVNYETALHYLAYAILYSHYDGYDSSEKYAYERINEMVDNGYITEEQVDAKMKEIGLI